MTGPPPAPVVTVGETMGLLVAERVGVVSRGDEYRLGFGGAESNVAVGLTRLGVPAAWIGRVGDDDTGRMIVRELRAEGVDVRVTVDADAPTGAMLKQRRTPELQRVEYLRVGSAGSRLSPSDVTAERIGRAALVHLTGITPALSASARAAVEQVLASGLPVSLDVNHRPSLWSDRAAATFHRTAIPAVAVVFAGLDEARLVIGREWGPHDAARALRDLGADTAVIKLGADGALAVDADGVVSAPAVPVTPVDTVGAGDAFVAGWLAELVRGADAQTRLRTANRTAAFACLSPGDWDGYPRADELDLLDRTETVLR